MKYFRILKQNIITSNFIFNKIMCKIIPKKNYNSIFFFFLLLCEEYVQLKAEFCLNPSM